MELKEIIEKINALKKELDELGSLPKDAMERLEQKIRMEWNYHSNVIEGNQLDYGETRSLLLWGITAKGKPLKDHLDLEGHNEAIKKLEAIASNDIAITESLIQEFHKLILAEPFNEYRKDVIVGDYKESNNYLYNQRGERIEFCPPEEVAKKLNDLINWTNNAISPPKRKKKQYDIHPLLIASRFHYEFINIHPFDDGNGRLARIFMNLILMQCGYPPIIIHKDLRPQYFSAIEDSRERGIEILADFMGEQLIKSLELYLKAAKGESIEEPEDLEKKIALLAKRLEGEEDLIEIKRSPEALKQVFDNVVEPFLNKLVSKSASFKKLFCNVKLFYLQIENKELGFVKFIETSFPQHIKELRRALDVPDFYSEELIILFEAFKKESVSFDAQIFLSIKFEDLKLIIKAKIGNADYRDIFDSNFATSFDNLMSRSSEEIIAIPYHKKLDESLINKKVEVILNELYKYIEVNFKE